MRNITAIRRQIIVNWREIVRYSGVKRAAYQALPATPKLLGSSTKVQLGEKIGVLTAVSYFAPARESGAEMCSKYATPACIYLCLGHNSGRLAMAPAKKARLWKTALYHGDRTLFCTLMMAEIEAHARKAATLGLEPAIRIDGSSDTGIGFGFAPLYPELHFYDYTKDPHRALASISNHGCANYDVTLSYSGENWDYCCRYLCRGGRVAMVFDVQKGAQLPATYHGFPIVDGDQHDAVYRQPPGVIVGLRLKAARNVQKMRKFGLGGRFVMSPADCDA